MRDDELTGTILDGKYKLEKLLGEGGMGVVYQGTHLLIGRKIAVKFLHQALTGHEEAVKRFYREARAAAAIGHKNIIDVLDVGITGSGTPYLVMEFLEGEGLAEILERQGFFSLEQALGILEPVLLALHAAHERGVVHRDLKPDNIFVVHNPDEPPTVKLIDFGISKVATASGTSKLTRDGSMLGTPAYMSPEQAKGEPDVDHRTDIYAMGVILFEMLTGEMPFLGEQYNELLYNIITAPPRDPVDIREDFPARAWTIIKKALEKDPAGRYDSAKEMLEEIRDVTDSPGRITGLLEVGAAMKTDGTGIGDLGPLMDPVGDDSIAQVVFSETVAIDREVVREEPAKKRPRWLVPGAAGVGGLVLIALLVGLCSGGEDEAVIEDAPTENVALEDTAPAEDEAQKEDAVTITVEGHPDGSKVYYEDSLVPVNPFKVKKAGTLAPLRVEAPGYDPFRVSLVPSKDRTVKVSMKEEAPDEDEAKDEDESPKAKPAKSKAKPAKKGKRKSKIRKFFDSLGN